MNRAKKKLRDRRYYLRHAEKKRARERKRYAENLAEMREKSRLRSEKERKEFPNRQRLRKEKWRKKHKKALVIYYKKYRQDKFESVSASRKRYYNANPSVILAAYARRRARNKSASGCFTATQIASLFEKQQGKCALCKTRITLEKKKPNTLHRDHKRPLSRGGSNSIRNIQLTCAPCNFSKGCRY